ncbi:MAG: hypothetical protein QOG89_3256, partial [Thermomicrobiales bacterium]|nr:hypothetical protein [Thermomicrobiales bacterium]
MPGRPRTASDAAILAATARALGPADLGHGKRKALELRAEGKGRRRTTREVHGEV